jgi:hypothetical protein
MARNIKDRIKSYEDACEALGKQPITDFGDATPDEIAYKKLKTVIKALNEGWTPDFTIKRRRWYMFSNKRQRKWFPSFCVEPSGLEFGWTEYESMSIHAGCTARLCLKSDKLANYVGEQFLDLWKDFLL